MNGLMFTVSVIAYLIIHLGADRRAHKRVMKKRIQRKLMKARKRKLLHL